MLCAFCDSKGVVRSREEQPAKLLSFLGCSYFDDACRFRHGLVITFAHCKKYRDEFDAPSFWSNSGRTGFRNLVIVERICELAAGQPFADLFGEVKCESVGIFAETFIHETQFFAIRAIQINRNFLYRSFTARIESTENVTTS